MTTSGANDEIVSAVGELGEVVHEGDLPLGTSVGFTNALSVAHGSGLDTDVALTSADTIYLGDLRGFYDGWNHSVPRLLVAPDLGQVDFAPCWRFTGTALLPRALVSEYEPRASDIVDDLLRPAVQGGDAELYAGSGSFFDCGTPLEYWLAMMHLTGGGCLVEPGAQLLGRVDRCVVLRDAVVHDEQEVSDAVVHAGGAMTFGTPMPSTTIWAPRSPWPPSACKPDPEGGVVCE